jgi:hypothetical protein
MQLILPQKLSGLTTMLCPLTSSTQFEQRQVQVYVFLYPAGHSGMSEVASYTHSTPQ